MKKQRKENPAQAALATLAAKLSSSNLQTARPLTAPSDDYSSISGEAISGENDSNSDQSQPSNAPIAKENISNMEVSTEGERFEDHNLQISGSTEPSVVVVTNNFQDYVGQVIQIPVEKLRIEDNVRTQIIEDEDFEALVGSIKEKGVLQNLVAQVSILPEGREDLVLISGQRRWLACRKAGLTKAPCLIIAAEDQRTRIVYGLIENLLREDLTPIDIAFAYRKLMDLGATQEELAQTFGCHKKTIQRYLSLTTWPQAAIDILKGHPRLFSTDFLFNGISRDILSDSDLLILRLSKIVEQAKAATTEQVASHHLKLARSSDAIVLNWNQTARRKLGVPVTMSGSRDNLRITIRCQGDENVKRILEKLGITAD